MGFSRQEYWSGVPLPSPIPLLFLPISPPTIKQGQKETQMFHCSVTRLCLTLCDLMDYSTPSCSVFHYLQESESVSCLVLSDSCDFTGCSLPGSSVHRILQASILEWVANSFSGDLPDSGIEPWSPTLWADSLQSKPPEKPLSSGVWSNSCPLSW